MNIFAKQWLIWLFVALLQVKEVVEHVSVLFNNLIRPKAQSKVEAGVHSKSYFTIIRMVQRHHLEREDFVLDLKHALKTCVFAIGN